MKNKILSLLMLFFFFVTILFTNINASAASSSYYATTEGLTGHELLEELAKITRANHKTTTSYDSLKTHLKETDPDPNKSGAILDFYSRISTTSWNREHVWPKSLSGGTYVESGAGADVHHIRPTINNINSTRSNKKFTDFSMVDESCNEYRYDGTLVAYQNSSCWEPLDNVKGDTARIVMYMYMHYNNTDIEANKGYSLAGNMQIESVVYGNKNASVWDILLYWNDLDPVDDYEMDRNTYCASVTGTRNPFIDYPDFADAIWGNGTGVTPDDDLGNNTPSTPSNPDVPTTPESPTNPSEPNVGVGEYYLVENANDLKANDKIVIAAANSNLALSTTQNGNNRGVSNITKNGSTILINDTTQVITLETGKVSNTFGFNVGNGYLYAASSSSNYLRTESTLTNNGSWEITISSGTTTIKSKGSYSRNLLQYNNSANIFSCYSSGQQAVSIYKLNETENTPDDDKEYTTEVLELFDKYYNNGVYKKDTIINLTSDAQNDLIRYFHASSNILERTTYYNVNELWMSRGNGYYSYYGTNSLGLTNGTASNPNTVPEDAKVAITGTSMLEYYTTLLDFKESNAVWYKEGNTYYTTSEEILRYYLDFTAPCLLSDIFESEYFIYSKATLEVVDNELVMKLIIEDEMYNALSVNDNVLSQATISISEYALLNDTVEYVESLDGLTFKSNYSLPTYYGNATINWAGNNVNNNILTYTSPSENEYYFLTATITLGDLVKEVSVYVCELKYEEVNNDTEYEYTEFTQEELDIFTNNVGYVLPFIPTDLYEVELDTVNEWINYYTYGNTPSEFELYLGELESLGFTYDSTYEYDGVEWLSYIKNGRYLDLGGYYTDEEEPIYVIDIYCYTYDTGVDTPVGPTTPSNPTYSTLYFNDLNNRTEFNQGLKQVWTNGLVTLTNAGNCADYYNPVRLYANTNVEISGSGITTIVFSCAAKTDKDYYAEYLLDSLSGDYTNVYLSNDTVTLTLDRPTDLIEFNTVKQIRLVNITVYFG